jgi:hypothetical protein
MAIYENAQAFRKVSNRAISVLVWSVAMKRFSSDLECRKGKGFFAELAIRFD